MEKLPSAIYEFTRNFIYIVLKLMISCIFFSRMHSSLETPSDSHQTHNQYHSNAFNMHSTASKKTTTGAALAPKTNGNVKPIIRPSTDAQSSTIFNNNSNRNKFSYGAYNSTCSNNNIEHDKHNVKPTMFNEKMWVWQYFLLLISH